MNNIQFPEMNSITSSAGSDILETLNADILKVPEGIPESILKNSSVPAPVLTQANQNKVLHVQKPTPVPAPVPAQLQQHKPSAPVPKPTQTKPLPTIPENSKSVSFDNNIQHKTISPANKASNQTTQAEPGSIVPVEVEQNTTVKKNMFSKLFGSATEDGVDHLLKVGNFKMPKKTLMLIVLVAVVSGGLFYFTRNKPVKKHKKKTDEDDEN